MPNRFLVTPFFLDQPSPELETLTQPDWELNRPALPEGDLHPRMSALHEPIAAFVAGALAEGERPVSIAGDCCTTLGMLAGLQRAGANPALLWLDAHGDFNTWETTPSGFLGGMPLAMLVGRGELTMAKSVGLQPLPENQVILSDGRDLDPPERLALQGSQVHHLSDLRAVLDDSLLAQPLWVHFDTDILNPQDAPAMSYLAPGGPSAVEIQALFRHLAQHCQIVAVSMTTWTPRLDRDGKSREVCMALLRTLIEDGVEI
jgi:arginase